MIALTGGEAGEGAGERGSRGSRQGAGGGATENQPDHLGLSSQGHPLTPYGFDKGCKHTYIQVSAIAIGEIPPNGSPTVLGDLSRAHIILTLFPQCSAVNIKQLQIAKP